MADQTYKRCEEAHRQDSGLVLRNLPVLRVAESAQEYVRIIVDHVLGGHEFTCLLAELG
jgi:hypothetical protein